MNSTGWGGKRVGAGRKPSSAVRVSVRLPRALWVQIQRQAEEREMTPEELVISWIEREVGTERG